MSTDKLLEALWPISALDFRAPYSGVFCQMILIASQIIVYCVSVPNPDSSAHPAPQV